NEEALMPTGVRLRLEVIIEVRLIPVTSMFVGEEAGVLLSPTTRIMVMGRQKGFVAAAGNPVTRQPRVGQNCLTLLLNLLRCFRTWTRMPKPSRCQTSAAHRNR